LAAFGAPTEITMAHETDQFRCGRPGLDEWLRRRALSNHLERYTSVRVVAAGPRVVAYYGLSSSSIVPSEVPRSLRGGQPPDPVPAFLIARLAVDIDWQHRRLGRAMVQDALRCCLAASRLVGSRLLMVHALDPEAAVFYRNLGFVSSRTNPLLLMQPLKRVASAQERR
jgi:GNAT superfamily N-acetyltransferase